MRGVSRCRDKGDGRDTRLEARDASILTAIALFETSRTQGRIMARFQYVTQIEIDPGAVRLLPQECRRLNISRPLVVSDAGVRAAGVLERALVALEGHAVTVFDQTPGNPNE